MFIFASIAFRFESPGAVDLQLLSYLRQHFPEAFREESLYIGTPAAYDRNFGQSLSHDPSAVRRFQKPPLPFAFRVPSPAYHADTHDTALVLTVAGAAVNDIACYLGGVRRILSSFHAATGRKVTRYETATISADGAARLLQRDTCDVSLINGDDLLPPCWPVTEVTLDIVAPLRLVKGEEGVRRLSFPDFIRPLMRRISSLAYYYCGFEYDVDFRGLAAGSLTVSTDDRLLVWKRGAHASSGFQGRVVFSGEVQEYLRFIVLGERFNLGKGAAYGMGSYAIAKFG